MTEKAAIELARAHMTELGASNFIIRYRHLKLEPDETRIIRAENQFYFLLDFPVNVKVESKAGWYDTKSTAINEQQHVHRGLITIQNYDSAYNDLRFIQVIPRHQKELKT